MSNILFVCTANICRSPAAEAIARTRFGSGVHRFASAGFLFENRVAEPDMVRALGDVGVDASLHRSRILSDDIIDGADIILTMEARHVQDLSVKSAEIFAKTLPLVEAANRLAHGPMQTDSFLASFSGRDPMAYFDARWDVEDPYKRSRRKYRKSVEQIWDLVGAVVPALT